MSSRYKLSVIIPVYNAEKHIEACIDSVLDSRSTEYEIILVDDGSTDGSAAVCDRYAAEHDNVTVIHTVNGGAAAARNAALEAAGGAYVTFTDSDDTVESGYIDRAIEALASGDDIIVFSFMIEYTQDPQVRTMQIPSLSSVTPSDAMREMEKSKTFNVLWNKLYRRELLMSEPAARFEPDTEPGEDLLFNCLCLSRARKVSLINEAYYHWIRRGEDTLANRYRPDLIEKNRMFIEARCGLYRSLGMDGTDLPLLAEGNMAYVFSCIPNMYRKGHIFPRRQRIAYYKEILRSDDVRGWVAAYPGGGALMRQFIRLYRFGSAGCMDAFYSSATWFRRTMDGAWRRMRKRMTK